jgi:hypothetical protein
MHRPQMTCRFFADKHDADQRKAEQNAEKYDLERAIAGTKTFHDDIVGRENTKGEQGCQRPVCIAGHVGTRLIGWHKECACAAVVTGIAIINEDSVNMA